MMHIRAGTYTIPCQCYQCDCPIGTFEKRYIQWHDNIWHVQVLCEDCAIPSLAIQALTSNG